MKGSDRNALEGSGVEPFPTRGPTWPIKNLVFPSKNIVFVCENLCFSWFRGLLVGFEGPVGL